MSRPKRIVINRGVVTGFADEVSFEGVTLTAFEKTRVSHIVPKHRFLRCFFRVVRRLFGEESTIADWTRSWGCKWLVVIDGIACGSFPNRSQAIEHEKRILYETHPAFQPSLRAPGSDMG